MIPDPPPDEEITAYLQSMCETDAGHCEEILDQLSDTIEDHKQNGNSEVWAYGSMVNFLSNVMDKDDLVHTCASALWKLHGQNHPDIRVITETDREKGDRT